MMKYLIVLLIPLLFFSCKHKEPKLDITWELVDNLVNDNGDALWMLTFTNPTEYDFPDQGWTLYFNNLATPKTDSLSGLSIEAVNGDLRAIKPQAGFKGIPAGSSFQCTMLAGSSVINFTDAPMGFYLVYDQNPQNSLACDLEIKDINTTKLKRTNNELLPTHTAEIEYLENKDKLVFNENDLCPITPTPNSITKHNGSLNLKDEISIHFADEFESEAQFLKDKFASIFSGNVSLNTSTNANISLLVTKSKLNEEAYTLNISDEGISIEASSKQGLFYGIQSLLALAPIDAWKNPSSHLKFQKLSIADEPRFVYRGLFLDVARNFQEKDDVLKILDAMAFYKLNKFHFHICDDEGWRVEIPGLPELTEYGAYRGYSLNEEKYLYPSFGSGANADAAISHGSGYYTREDFIEIVKYANERHIEIIPEIDMPGHARAAIRSMQVRYNKYMALGKDELAKEFLLSDLNDQSQYKSVQGWTDNVIDVSMESSYRFLEKITDEMIAIFKEANAPLTTIHTGGDEVPHGVWKESPSCKQFLANNKEYKNSEALSQYFIHRFSWLLADRGLTAAGWEEIALLHGEEIKPNPEFVGKNFQPYVWNNMWNSGAEDIGYQLANAGYPIVLAHVTNFYFDLAYNKHPQEPGYYWGSFIDTKKPWEYTPLDISKCAEEDRFGNPIDRNKIQQSIEGLSVKGAKNVLGIQAVLWSENNLGPERMEYFYFPKIIGLAERAWAKQPKWASIENDVLRKEHKSIAWDKFTINTGLYDLQRLNYMKGGYEYRIPPPGAIIKEGILHANVRYAGLSIRYTTDGLEPNAESALYTEAVKVNGTIKLKSFSSNGRSSRTVSVK